MSTHSNAECGCRPVSTASRRFRSTVAFAAAGVLASWPILAQPRYWSGQTVSPAFEGWAQNADRTFSLYFGYFSRNWEEEVDIPVGPKNFMEPAQDQGQPTHFLTARHKNIFSVVVASDFGNKRLGWTLSYRGREERAIGTLDPLWQIDVSRDPRTGNTAPVVTASPEQTIDISGAALLSISAVDDGLPRSSARVQSGSSINAGSDLIVEWDKYRGPGEVIFSQRRRHIVDGRAVAEARFSAPGIYLLEAVVDDGSRTNLGFTCCWTNAWTKITVIDGGARSKRRSPVSPRG